MLRGHIPWLLALALSTAAHAFQQQTVDVGGHSVPVIVPDTYHHGTQKALPVVLLLHGFCTPPRWQEFLTLIASRGLFGDAGPSVLSQAGLAELVDGVEFAFDDDFEEDNGTLVENLPVSTPPFLYVIPTAPHVTSVCALCGTNSTDSSPAAEVASIFAQTVRLVPGGGCPAWDATDECCAMDRLEGERTDVEFARQTLRAVQDAYRVDVRRQYAVGIGNGGFMALRLACEMPGELAAVASFGGAGAGRVEACQPPEDQRTHVLEIHAVGDLFVRYDGARNIQGNRYPDAVTTTRRFADLSQCDLVKPLQHRFYLPAPYERYGADVQVAVDTTEFTSRCMDGGSATHWRLTEGGHFLPRDTSRALWARTVGWLVSHQRPRTIADDRRQRDIDLRAEIQERQESTRHTPTGWWSPAVRGRPFWTRLMEAAFAFNFQGERAWPNSGRLTFRDALAPSLSGQGDDPVLSATHLLTTAVRTTVTFAELAVESLVQPMSSRALRRELVASLAEHTGLPPRNVAIDRIVPHSTSGTTTDVTVTVYFEGTSARTMATARRLAHTASSALAGTMAHLRPLGVFDVHWGVVNISQHPAAAAAAAAASTHGQRRGAVRRWLYRDVVQASHSHMPTSTLLQ